MADETPSVSVIVRTKDRPALLRQALASIAVQPLPNLEVVLVNDGGEDVHALATSICEPRGVALREIVHPQSLGRVAAANAGFQAAQGEWISILDDDDVYVLEGLAELIRNAQLQDVDCAYGEVILQGYTADGHKKSADMRMYGRPFSRQLLLLQNYIPFNAICFRRHLLETVGGIREDMDVFEDWEFLVRLTKVATPVFLQVCVAEYRVFETSTITGTRFTTEEMQAAERKLLDGWWGDVTPQAVSDFRAYIYALAKEELAAAAAPPPPGVRACLRALYQRFLEMFD